MQQTNHWPEAAELPLPEEVIQDLHQQLVLPFDSETEAKAFWQEAHCSLIILDPTDDTEDLKQKEDTWNEIDFALTYTEYTVPLSLSYTLAVTITNDSGSCIFLIVPPELSGIVKEYEAATHE